MKIKICGMRDPQNIDDIAALRPDYLGFIFAPDSPRFVGERLHAVQLVNLDPDLIRVGVFVDQPIEEVLQRRKEYFLQAVQLHGAESPDYCQQLLALEPGLWIIKAFAVDAAFDFRRVDHYQDCCRFCLFDTRSERAGGSGQAFDWTILERYQGQLPFFTAGGIGRHNITALLQCLERCEKAYGIDLNSQIEVQPGRKSAALAEAVIAEVRR